MTDEQSKKPGIAYWAAITVVVLLVTSVIYFGAYAYLIDSYELIVVSNDGREEPYSLVQARYPGGSPFLHRFFRPANWLDRRVRPDIWRGHDVWRGGANFWAAASPGITTRDILAMTQKGVFDSIIVNVIRTRGGNFDTSPEAEAGLTAAGVSDAAIEAMRRATSPEAGNDELAGGELAPDTRNRSAGLP